ncbi:MAG: hypothetical protein L7S71_00340, partial [Pseudomonadales bacterium]|nr:hypothetical protein [Pseudomonadales bacterium]
QPGPPRAASSAFTALADVQEKLAQHLRITEATRIHSSAGVLLNGKANAWRCKLISLGNCYAEKAALESIGPAGKDRLLALQSSPAT